MNRRSLVPGRLQSTAELSYEFVANMVRENVGEKGMKYFPWIFTIFIFILVLNMLGLLPYSFTVTSHIIVTFALAAMVWLIDHRHRLHEPRRRLPEAVRAVAACRGG